MSLYNRRGELADNVTNNVAFLYYLKKRGNTDTADGGVSIIEELSYAENAGAAWYSGYETLSLTPNEFASAAQYEWKQLAVPIIISGLDMMKNSGKERVINHLKSKVSNAEDTMMNKLGAACYADGTGTSGKEPGGLQLIVADTNTNTVGGISGSTYSWWKNVSYDLSSVGSTASTTNIQTHMNSTYVQLKRNNEGPDVVLADNNYFTKFLGSLQTIQRIMNTDTANAGFTNVQYMGLDVILDGGRGGNCPSNRMYWLNTKYLHYRPHADRNMVPLEPDRFSTNQDALVRILTWGGNFTCSNRFMQAVMKA